METGLERLSDREVEAALHEAVSRERRATAQVLRCLIEFERRHLHERKAYGSLFDYCRGEFGYSEHAAYKRTAAAKTATKYPSVLDLLETRKIDLGKIVVVGPHLTAENHGALLEQATRLSVRELEFHVAGLAPKEPKRDSIRSLPASVPMAMAPTPPQMPLSQASPAPLSPSPLPARLFDRVEPVSESLARVAFTADRRTVSDIERACQLMGCTRSNLSRVMASAVEALLNEIDPDRRLASKRPRKPRAAQRASRRIPQHVRDARLEAGPGPVHVHRRPRPSLHRPARARVRSRRAVGGRRTLRRARQRPAPMPPAQRRRGPRRLRQRPPRGRRVSSAERQRAAP